MIFVTQLVNFEDVKKLRNLILYKNYFKEFYEHVDDKAKDKIDLGLYHLQFTRHIPNKFVGSTKDKNLFYLRIKHSSNIYRIFFCFDEGKLVVLFNGFHKKTQKLPKSQINRAHKIKQQYFDEKE